MANKKRAIGAIIKLDGENAFKSSVKNCRSSLAAMHSSLKNIQASYSGNANSLEALSAVFTDDSIKGVNMVLQEGMDNVRGYREELENCDGAAEQMADTMSDNLQGAMDSTSLSLIHI